MTNRHAGSPGWGRVTAAGFALITVALGTALWILITQGASNPVVDTSPCTQFSMSLDRPLLARDAHPFTVDVAGTTIELQGFPDGERVDFPVLSDGNLEVSIVDGNDGTQWRGLMSVETKTLAGDGLFSWYRCQILRGHLDEFGVITPTEEPPHLP